jgi:flagellar motor protein MotB
MKLLGILSTAFLSLTLGAAAPAYAQQEEHAQQEEKHVQQEDKKTQSGEPAQEEKHAQQEEKKAEQQKPAQQEEKHAQQEEKKAEQEKSAQRDEHHEEQAQRADNHRIPEDRFRANFGREHVFIINRPVIVEGRPRFQYGGFWFGFGQPWPVGWLYTDNVYVDYIDGGYYLYNPFHPGIRVIVTVI